MITIRPTSIIAYNEIVPKLNERYVAIIQALSSTIDATDYELAKMLGKSDPNYVRPRRYELVNKYKLVCYSQTRKCFITGKTALAWKLLKK